MIQGKVGKKNLVWKITPRGKAGEGHVSIDGKEVACKWVRDDQGIWIETDQGFFGYEVRKFTNDDGSVQYQLIDRIGANSVMSLGFLKTGEEQDPNAAGKTKKAAKVKSQMPGKIVRVLVKVGDSVKKGQSLLVMEAMKMENEIKAVQDATVKEIKVIEGQAIETGAELLVLS